MLFTKTNQVAEIYGRCHPMSPPDSRQTPTEHGSPSPKCLHDEGRMARIREDDSESNKAS